MAEFMQESSTSGLYDLWSKIYDATFGALVHKRQQRAIEALGLKPGDRVLDLGVGTGMTLPLYPRDVEVVGFDLSGGMLRKAAEKAREQGLANTALVQADALLPPLADESFDHILITHVITVVSDPVRLLREAKRMVKPGGRVVILNHFTSTYAPVRFFERRLNPLFVKIGWKSDLELIHVLRGCPMGLACQFKTSVFDLWEIVVLCDSQQVATAPAELLAGVGS